MAENYENMRSQLIWVNQKKGSNQMMSFQIQGKQGSNTFEDCKMIQKNQTVNSGIKNANKNIFCLQYGIFMQIQQKSSSENLSEPKSQQLPLSDSSKKSTLGNLIDNISFEKKKTKPIKKKTFSETSSISSNNSINSKQKSKLWTEQENEKFLLLIKKHGPDFQLLGKFFEKKSKNQLKNKYKEYLNSEKKNSKQQNDKIKAVTVGSLFQDVQEGQEYA